MLIAEILKAKGDLVFTLGPSDTVAAAARLLHERRVGALVVHQENDGIAGIVSERDIVRALARDGGRGAGAVRSPTYMTPRRHLRRADGDGGLAAGPYDRPARPPSSRGRPRTARGHPLHRRPCEGQDRRDRRGGPKPQGLHSGGLTLVSAFDAAKNACVFRIGLRYGFPSLNLIRLDLGGPPRRPWTKFCRSSSHLGSDAAKAALRPRLTPGIVGSVDRRPSPRPSRRSVRSTAGLLRWVCGH